MDKSTFRHQLSIEIEDDRNFHAFVRTDDGSVEHYFSSVDEAIIFGPEDLGGRFESEPIVVWRFSGGSGELHLIGRSGMELVDWSWSHRVSPQLLGAPSVSKLPAFSLADPEVIVSGEVIHVFAASLDGPMRHWVNESVGADWSGQQVLSEDKADHWIRPCAVVRESGTIDLFAANEGETSLLHWFFEGGAWRSEELHELAFGTHLAARPTAVSYAPERLDVFAVCDDGVPVHWGFDGDFWFGPEARFGAARLVVGDDLQLTSTGDKQLTLFARRPDANGQPDLVDWTFDATIGEWRGPQEYGSCACPLAVWVAGFSAIGEDPTGSARLVTRTLDGAFTVELFALTAAHSIDGMARWESEGEPFFLTREEPAPPPGDFTPATTDPDLVARRADDLVMLGVHWNEGVDVETGPPLELVAGSDAELTVTLPPQHIREEVVRGKGDFRPPTPPAQTGGVPVWRSSLAGPSQVVVALDEGTRVPLTVEGALTALRGGHVLPAVDLTDPRTQLELPTGLLMTPFRGDGTSVVLDHPAGAVVGPGGAVGVWSSRVAAEGAAPSDPAGLSMRPLAPDAGDDFPTSLSRGARARIFAEEPTARIHRLRLSALGATLSASGSWDTYSWDHFTTMGRDHKVRTATQGVLYPFGNRAVFVESSERFIVDTSQGAVAHLLKTSVLIISEPVKELPPSRSFPFTRVELQRTLVEFGEEPKFQKTPFPDLTADQATAGELGLRFTLEEQLRQVIPERGRGDPLVEDFAHLLVPASDEENQAADDYLVGWLSVTRNRAKAAALRAGANPQQDLFIVPEDGGQTIHFPVLLSGPSGQVHVQMPVVFVADLRLPDGLLHPAFQSLQDPDVHQRVAAAFASVGGEGVSIAPMLIDMVGAAVPQPADSPLVRRLHIVGEPSGGGYAPRLGTVVDAGEGQAPPAERWAFEMAMTELDTLAGQDAGAGASTLVVALSQELLSGATDPGLLYVVPVGGKVLTAEFSRNSARSGGLAAPDLLINGVSRTQGPVNAETFLAQVQQRDLNPATFLGPAANLMGVKLADLIDATRLEGTPRILSDAQPGKPPKVTMLWLDVPLKSASGVVMTFDASTLTIDATLAPDSQKVVGTVKEIALVFPSRDEKEKLLEVHLRTVEFTQDGGGAPRLRVDGVKVRFFGFLKLLEKLQDAVKLDNAPAIEASDRGVTATFDLPIPDVTTGAFQLTGLTFHSVIDVPFDQRPVSIELAFASREDPFNVSVLALGGGGYVDIALDSSGLKRLEIALEFGASIEVDFFVATGEVHAMGGIRVTHDGVFNLAGYLRFGGMVEVLGLVSVSIELVVTLEYVGGDTNAMIGRATLVLEIDLLLFSDSVELDSGPWVLTGNTPARDAGPRPLGPVTEPVPVREPITGVDPEVWRSYRAAFDEAALR